MICGIKFEFNNISYGGLDTVGTERMRSLDIDIKFN